MYSAGLINNQVQRSPSFNGIISEFISAMEFIRIPSEIEEHCIKFLSVFTKLGGSFTRAAKVLKEDWVKVCRTECGLELKLNIWLMLSVSFSYLLISYTLTGILNYKHQQSLVHNLREDNSSNLIMSYLESVMHDDSTLI